MSASAKAAQASISCSQLSSTSSACLPRRWSISVSTEERDAPACTPSASTTARSSSFPSCRAASCTSQTPPEKARRTMTATWTARRVLPTPPGPVSISTHADDNNRLMLAASR